jgi:hypothetical protein
MIGALIPTLLISRLFLWLFGKTTSGIVKVAWAHVGSLAVCWVLSALGGADGGPLAWGGGVFYVIPQLIWFCADLLRGKTKNTDLKD